MYAKLIIDGKKYSARGDSPPRKGDFIQFKGDVYRVAKVIYPTTLIGTYHEFGPAEVYLEREEENNVA